MTQVCKPNSVIPEKTGTAIIYLIPTLLSEFSGLPEEIESEQLSSGKNRNLFCLTLHRVGFAVIPGNPGLPKGTSGITTGAVGSYPAFSPLPRQNRGGIFSVALSVVDNLRCQPPGVTRHPVLRCSDFPLLKFNPLE